MDSINELVINQQTLITSGYEGIQFILMEIKELITIKTESTLSPDIILL